jgi:sodium/bile acid cotransporter 7
VILWNTYDQAFESGAFRDVAASNIIFIVFVSVGLFLVSIGVSFATSLLWLSREDAVSVCYCVPAKTPAMGVPFVMTMFVGLSPLLQAKLQIPLVIFQGLQLVGGTALIRPFARWVDAGKAKAEAEKDPC